MFEGFFKIMQAFEAAGVEDPLKETLSVIDVVFSGAVRNMDGDFPAITGIAIQELIEKRCQGVPIEYALGYGTFMGMRFFCSPAALIPRQETELLAGTAIELAKGLDKGNAPVLIVDMGTGSGNIAVSIAAHVENTHIMACDVSPEAIGLARSNVDRYNLQSRISLFCGDLFEPLSNDGHQGSVDMVVCNPPYIPTASLAKLAREIIDHEPVVALDAGAYGIDIFRRVISQSPDYLRPGGVLVFEIGQGQEKFVTRLLQKSGAYSDLLHYADSAGQIRVISASNT
jgi:release factor glutamine methyltransferase